MLAIVQLYVSKHNLIPCDFFRSAYMNKFQKDISQSSLDEDVRKYQSYGTVPPYVVDFMLKIYGAH